MTMMLKVFGGKKYDFYASYTDKPRAKTMAKRFRESGEPARVIKDTDGQWAVYVRYGKGRGFRH